MFFFFFVIIIIINFQTKDKDGVPLLGGKNMVHQEKDSHEVKKSAKDSLV